MVVVVVVVVAARAKLMMELNEWSETEGIVDWIRRH